MGEGKRGAERKIEKVRHGHKDSERDRGTDTKALRKRAIDAERQRDRATER